MICKHFNLPWTTVRDDLDYFEYVILLAEALDAEELADYNFAVLTAIAFNAPKQIKKWKWQSPDRAGTRETGTKPAAEGLAKMALSLSGGKLQGANELALQRAFERARSSGRPLIFMDNDGNYYTPDWQPAERTRNSIVIRVDKPTVH